MSKTNLKGLSLSQLEEFVLSNGETKYRAKQLMEWIYHKNESDFDKMTNISKAYRERLKSIAYIETLKLINTQTSPNKDTIKYLFELSDGKRIESVLIFEDDRTTVCISTQVGCALGCEFCTTAKLGFLRNLTTSEIIDQIVQIRRTPLSILPLLGGIKLTNIVFMGMGEPLLNYDNVISSAKLINDPLGFEIAARKITISTAGIVPEIYRLANEGKQFKLAISLNATTNELRNKLMPINKKYPIEELMKSAKHYADKTGKRVTFEYVLISEVNDTFEDAQRLIKLVKDIPCKINLIPYNPPINEILNSKSQISKCDLKLTRPSGNRVYRFQEYLYPHCPAVTIRNSKGNEISAACGQLSARE